MTLLLALVLAQADPRLVTMPYQETAVLRVVGHAGVESAIILGEDEHIENVAIGDANAWQVTPNHRANMLFLKPLAARARTNLTVVSDRHTYFFDLVAAPGARAIYALRLTYPVEARKEATPPPPPAPLTQEETALAHGEAPPVDPATLDLGWVVHGAHELAPSRVYADGHSTYIAWPKGMTLPAVLARDATGAEGPINYAMHDDMIVIAGTPHSILLRSGKLVATIDHQDTKP